MNILDAETEFKEKMLLDKIDELKAEVTRLKIALKEAGAEEDITDISDEEVLAVNQIERLKNTALERELDTDEVKRFEILHKQLRSMRGTGRNRKTDKAQGMTNAELIKALTK